MGLIFTFPTILSWVLLPSNCAAQTAGAGGGEQVSRSAEGLGGVRPTGSHWKVFPKARQRGRMAHPHAKHS